MKKLFSLSLLFLFTTMGFAQEIMFPPQPIPFDQDNKLIVYSKVIEIPGLNASELLNISKKYYIDKMKGKVKDIEIEDRENGLIMFKGNYYYSPKGLLNGPSIIFYDFEIRAKDGKAKLTVTPKKWVEYRDANYYEVMNNLTIPFPKPTGPLKNSIEKNRIKWYNEMDPLFVSLIDNCNSFVKEEADKTKKSRDF